MDAIETVPNAGCSKDNGADGEDGAFQDVQRVLSQANDAKVEGNKLAAAGKYEDALLKYELALNIASEVSSSDICAMCHGNRAFCFLSLGRHVDAVKECTKALEFNPSYAKAFARRGCAYAKLHFYEMAITDLKRVLELDPSQYQAGEMIQRLEPLAAQKRKRLAQLAYDMLNPHSTAVMRNSMRTLLAAGVTAFRQVRDPITGSYYYVDALDANQAWNQLPRV